MKILKINVTNKIAQSIDDCIVCGNSDYGIQFAFDDEWNAEKIKTARFIFNGTVVDVVFEGDCVSVPVVSNTTTLAVGVFAGDLKTTTPALIKCEKSILCADGLPPDPTPDVYAQIMELLNNGGGGGAEAKDGVSPVVEVTETENGHSVKITDVEGEHVFEVKNGKDYILTEDDKTEIAEQAAALIDTSIADAIGSGVLV